jgi:3-phenylpropionate/trans-cinnamate dioxygenase ferredoxin reductase component
MSFPIRKSDSVETQADGVVIAGGGLAAVRTAQALRDLNYSGRITLLSDEICLPYDRPPLSKSYLQGKANEEKIRLVAADKLAELGIDVRLNQPASGLDRNGRLVRLADGTSIDYGCLVVATGARPIMLEQLRSFKNVHVLRRMTDADALRAALIPGRSVGIIGAGFIGLEIAATATELGCQVTLIEAAKTPLASVVGAQLGECIQRWHERKGVKFRCGVKLAKVIGDSAVEALELTDGSSLHIDVVVVGIGQTPNIEWLAGSGLELHRGLVCDRLGQTADPLVFGVGDAVCCRVGSEYHPTRHWTATTEQARRVAGAICGQPETGPIVEDNYFWSDQHGSRLQFVGQVPADPRLVWVSGSPSGDRFAVLCCTAEHVAAVFSLGSVRDFLAHSMPLRRGERVAAPLA